MYYGFNKYNWCPSWGSVKLTWATIITFTRIIVPRVDLCVCRYEDDDPNVGDLGVLITTIMFVEIGGNIFLTFG